GEDVLRRAEVPDAAHDLDAERRVAALCLEPLAQLAQLLDDRANRLLVLAAQQEAGMEDDDLGADGLRHSRGVIQHPDRHAVLLAAVEVPEEGRDGRVDGGPDLAVRGQPADLGRPVPVHPETALEVDLTGRIAASNQQVDGDLGVILRRNSRGSVTNYAHPPTLADADVWLSRAPSGAGSTLTPCRSDRPGSISSSSTSTSVSPTSGAKPARWASGSSTSSPRSSGPPTARATAMRSPRSRAACSARSTGTACPDDAPPSPSTRAPRNARASGARTRDASHGDLPRGVR